MAKQQSHNGNDTTTSQRNPVSATTMRQRRRVLQQLAYNLALNAAETNAAEDFAKLLGVFERMFQGDVKAKANRKLNKPVRASLEGQRAILQAKLAAMRNGSN